MRALEDIKRLRRKHQITQKELSSLAGVSQSLIAKIESGSMDPTYSKARRIFEALDTLQEKRELKAKDIMNRKLCSVDETGSMKKVITIMKNKGISQLPVFADGKVRGIITESAILKKTMQTEDIHTLKASDVMEDLPPIVSKRTGIKAISELLRDYPIVLVGEKGEIVGVISKSDLLGL